MLVAFLSSLEGPWNKQYSIQILVIIIFTSTSLLFGKDWVRETLYRFCLRAPLKHLYQNK